MGRRRTSRRRSSSDAGLVADHRCRQHDPAAPDRRRRSHREPCRRNKPRGDHRCRTVRELQGRPRGPDRYMAKEFGDRRIRANSIAPGAIRTELGGGLSDEFEAHLASATALGRVGEPEEIGGVIASLLSDDNRWINAQSIEVSGGSTSDARPWPLAGQRSRVLDRIHSGRSRSTSCGGSTTSSPGSSATDTAWFQVAPRGHPCPPPSKRLGAFMQQKRHSRRGSRPRSGRAVRFAP